MAFWLRDTERSPFGLGWEYARRGLDDLDCPFPLDSKESRQFSHGFASFKTSKTAEYDNPEINSSESGAAVRRRSA